MQCNQASRRRWWWWLRWGFPPCTSQSLPAYSGLLHPAECCPASSLCRAERGVQIINKVITNFETFTSIYFLSRHCVKSKNILCKEVFFVCVSAFRCGLWEAGQMWRRTMGRGNRSEEKGGKKLGLHDRKGTAGENRKRRRAGWDKSSRVERWQGWSWMQPLRAWWLIATKMSTSPRSSQCNHSARGVFKNTAAPTSQGGDEACVCTCFFFFLKSLCNCSVFENSKNKRAILFKSCHDIVLRGLFFSVPSCLALTDL